MVIIQNRRSFHGREIGKGNPNQLDPSFFSSSLSLAINFSVKNGLNPKLYPVSIISYKREGNPEEKEEYGKKEKK